ncbi:hypothetical protein T4B_5775 [Trichinella pseudospiralis]|uniref:Uncharacterized protein n=1 Tax=Trichinella pseudospiralis TaxID=6337 RepID=A0A0V1GS67_TRIPS|nr:hypothetical protein T4B_5775 [Trichinella pseudospiralis]
MTLLPKLKTVRSENILRTWLIIVSCRSKSNNDDPTCRPLTSIISDGSSFLFFGNVSQSLLF